MVYVGTVATMLLHFTRILAGLLCLLTVRVLWVVACHAFAQAHQLLVVLFLSSIIDGATATLVGNSRAEDCVLLSSPAALTNTVAGSAVFGSVGRLTRLVA